MKAKNENIRKKVELSSISREDQKQGLSFYFSVFWWLRIFSHEIYLVIKVKRTGGDQSNQVGYMNLTIKASREKLSFWQFSWFSEKIQDILLCLLKCAIWSGSMCKFLTWDRILFFIRLFDYPLHLFRIEGQKFRNNFSFNDAKSRGKNHI